MFPAGAGSSLTPSRRPRIRPPSCLQVPPAPAGARVARLGVGAGPPPPSRLGVRRTSRCRRRPPSCGSPWGVAVVTAGSPRTPPWGCRSRRRGVAATAFFLCCRCLIVALPLHDTLPHLVLDVAGHLVRCRGMLCLRFSSLLGKLCPCCSSLTPLRMLGLDDGC